jgi:hypothetical protein
MTTLIATPSEASREAPQHSATQHSTAHDGPLFRWIFPLLGVASLLASCILWSLRKQMWGDEIFTVTELRDPSLAHLLRAVPHLGGGGMPLFYLTGWPWAHVFGLSDLSLRLYSSLGVCGAFVILIATMRRYFSASAAFLGVAFGLFASLIVLDQNSEARGYGLYLLLCALAIAQALKVAETPRPTSSALALLVLSQAGLVLGHILGLVYAGLMLLALIDADAWQRRFRAKVYLCCIAGWLALIPWIPAIQASAAVGKPHGWIAMPTLSDLAVSLSFSLFTGLYWQLSHLPAAVLLAGWFCGIGCVVGLVLSAFGGLKTAPAKRPVYLLGFALILAPAAFFVISHIAAPIFLPRYLIPSALGIAMLAAAWTEQTKAGKGTTGTDLSLQIVLSCVVLALPIATALLARPTALDVSRIDEFAAGRPVVCDSLKDFLVMTRYSARPDLPEYPMNEAAANIVPGADTDFRLMKNYRREGYFSANLPDDSQILSRKSFLLLDNGDAAWFRVAIESNPRFTWKILAQVDDARRLIEVEQNPLASTNH